MIYATIAAFIAAVLFGVQYLLRENRANKVLSDLSRKDRTKEDDQIAAAQQELEDAEIRYHKSRADYDASKPGPDAS